MADKIGKARGKGQRPGSASRNQAGTTSIKNNIKSGTRDLLSREEEYKRLNEELEARTASLVREAEEVMRDQESVLSKPSLLDNINTEDFLNHWDADVDMALAQEEDREDTNLQISSRSVSSRPSSSRPPSSRPHSKVSNHARQQPQGKKPVKSVGSKTRGTNKTKSNIADNVAVPDEETFMTDFRDFSLQKTITHIEGQIEDGTLPEDEDDDVMPSAAAEMGAEAQIRFLKAKLRVMQEELDRLAQECTKRDEDNSSMLARMKELEEERNRLARTNSSQQSQIEKYKKLSEDAKIKADSLDSQLTTARKELEGLKRSQKQQLSTQNATEVRLNRALEEVDRFKSQLQQAKVQSKDAVDHDKRKLDQLLAENKRLEKQKNELLTGFKKQLKLIDVLKRQKMHIEAAKMLSFTEEEFVKALEWGS